MTESLLATPPTHAGRPPVRPALELSGFGRRFGKRWVVRGLDLSLAAGESLALTGANGSGKTTVLRCIAGTLTPTEGSIRIEGAPAGSLVARRSLGVSLAHERSFYLRLSGRENLAFFARARGLRGPRVRAAVDALAEELELSFLDERTGRYSAGMLQQLSLARALVGDGRVLLFDEPTRSLDTAARERFWAALERRPQTAVVLATHDAEEAARSSRVVPLGAT